MTQGRGEDLHMTQGGGGSSYDPLQGEDLHMTQGRGIFI